MQQAVDCWETGIRATGGAIRPEKVGNWYLLDFNWEGSQWRLKSISDTNLHLTVLNSQGSRELIQHREYNDPEITLGVYCTPDGSMTNQFTQMYKDTQDWADKITAGHMDHSTAYIALTTTIWKKLCYPLQATLLSKQECDQIMKPVLNAILPKMGLNRNFP